MKWLLLILLFILPLPLTAQLADIRAKIESLTAGKSLKAGIALCDLETNDTLNLHGEDAFPMQSVFKFPVALAVLAEVDKGGLKLEDSLYISREDLPVGTWSPIRERYPEGGVFLTLAEVIRYTVSQSDNIGCDLLLRLLGGPSYVNRHIRMLGIDGIDIAMSEAQMHSDLQAQYANRATPKAMIRLLRLFDSGQLLQKQTQRFLRETMAATTTGSVRTKLPAEAVVLHKTGSSDRDASGRCAATNDAGILYTRDGGRIAYCIFITESAETDAVNYGIIADLAHLLYNDYNSSDHE